MQGMIQMNTWPWGNSGGSGLSGEDRLGKVQP